MDETQMKIKTPFKLSNRFLVLIDIFLTIASVVVPETFLSDSWAARCLGEPNAVERAIW